MLDSAYRVAKTELEGLTRPDGTSDYAHSVRVSEKLTDDMGKVIGLLHDVCEAGYDLEKVYDEFGPEVGDAIDALTRRAGEVYADYIERVKGNQRAVLVKLADLDDNLNGAPDSLRKRYEKASRELFLAMMGDE